MKIPAVAFTTFLLFRCLDLFSQEIQLISDPRDPFFGAVRITSIDDFLPDITTCENVNDTAAQLLMIYPKSDESQTYQGLPPMLGTYTVMDSAILFAPRFPLIQGRSYVLLVRLGSGSVAGDPVATLTVPHLREAPQTIVVQVFPRSGHLPANQLKFYVRFSAPMGQDDLYHHISLRDGQGQIVPNAFLELTPPLWDAEHQILTLWFDPGRIKTGLAPNVKLGPPLHEGREFTLTIAGSMTDALGQPLGIDYVKSFVAVNADHSRPDPTTWEIVPARTGTRDTVKLIFPESMDFATLRSGIAVFSKAGASIEGQVFLKDQERNWLFVPKEVWQKGTYEIRISRRLEDLAGNNLNRLFDTYHQGVTKVLDHKTQPYLALEWLSQ